MNFKRLVKIATSLSPTNRTDLRNHHVTFILKKGKILAVGVNCKKTNTKNLKYDYYGRDNEHIGCELSTHSELKSIISYGKTDCSDCTFVNIRINRNFKLDSSYPCRGCRSLLTQVGFKKAYYSTKEGNFKEFIK